MTMRINPTEIYILDQYISPQYFEELRDTWAKMITHLEKCLNEFMQNLPPDYRRRALSHQPDAVWGERVLPNFRATLQSLRDGYIQLSHGEHRGLAHANSVLNDFKGQAEFWSGWMTKAQETTYGVLLHRSVRMAGNICATEDCGWNPGELTDPAIISETLAIPALLPLYSPDPNVTLNTDDTAKFAGIYIPDIESSCPQFMYPNGQEAPPATIQTGVRTLLHPVTGVAYGEEPEFGIRPCKWTLVRHVDNDSVAHSAPTLVDNPEVRVEGGGFCPAAGYYFTPAKANSRRWFNQGEIMPTFNTDYGSTIWQRDHSQND